MLLYKRNIITIKTHLVEGELKQTCRIYYFYRLFKYMLIDVPTEELTSTELFKVSKRIIDDLDKKYKIMK